MVHKLVKIYAKDCKSVRVMECIRWFQTNGIEYELVSLDEENFTFQVFKSALTLLSSTDDIIAKRSLDYKGIKDIIGDDMTLSELYKYAIQSKGMLKSPIVMDDSSKIMVGFKEEEASSFLSREKRGMSNRAHNSSCFFTDK